MLKMMLKNIRSPSEEEEKEEEYEEESVDDEEREPDLEFAPGGTK